MLDASLEIGCPESHPVHLIFEVWLGTKIACDCLDSGHEFVQNQVNVECTYGEDKVRNECVTVPPLAPVVQNRINGAIYCAQ